MNESQVNQLLKDVAYEINIDMQTILESETELGQAKLQTWSTLDKLRNSAKGKGLIKSFDVRNANSGSKISINTTGLDLTFGSNLPYASVHENGMFIKSKGKMQNYFFGMFKDTKLKFYKIMALSVLKKGGVTIKARPYFKKSLNELEKTINETVTRLFLSKIEL